ncbi:MAG: hypothetical protein IJA20_10675 [Methanocorpusculum sp.]|nr:hypothetical protein [Methanocorpusculum sp.]
MNWKIIITGIFCVILMVFSAGCIDLPFGGSEDEGGLSSLAALAALSGGEMSEEDLAVFAALMGGGGGFDLSALAGMSGEDMSEEDLAAFSALMGGGGMGGFDMSALMAMSGEEMSEEDMAALSGLMGGGSGYDMSALAGSMNTNPSEDGFSYLENYGASSSGSEDIMAMMESLGVDLNENAGNEAAELAYLMSFIGAM